MIQIGTLELIGSCFCLVGFDRNHVDFYFLPCICKRFDLGLARGSLRVSQGVRSQTTCDVQASWSKLFLQAKQVKLEVKISCRMLSPFLCRSTHTSTFSHTLTHLTLTLTLWVSHSLISLTLSLSHSLTQSIMNRWFDHLIIDAFIHLSTMQPTKPKNPVIMQTWARYSHRSTYSSMHAHVRALIYSMMRFNIHSCMHSCKERSPQSSSIAIYRDLQRSTKIYRDLQRSTVWMCIMFVLICTYLYRVVWSCETLLFGLRNLCAVGDAPPARGVGQATKELHQWDHKTSQDITRLWTWTDMDELCSNYAIIDHNWS